MQAGTYTFTLKLMDSAGGSFTPAPYTWRISPLTNFYFTLPLTGTTIPAGAPYSQPLLVAGGSNSYTFTAVTPLPAGLSIDSNTGVISGTPTLGGSVSYANPDHRRRGRQRQIHCVHQRHRHRAADGGDAAGHERHEHERGG